MSPIEKGFARCITFFDKLIISKLMPNDKPKIRLELKKMLYDLYSKDIESLEKLINRDLSAWRVSEK
ncbi:hypothetical protein OAA14_02540 [bacterium]|nr:hypothetical protein [bacterium]